MKLVKIGTSHDVGQSLPNTNLPRLITRLFALKQQNEKRLNQTTHLAYRWFYHNLSPHHRGNIQCWIQTTPQYHFAQSYPPQWQIIPAY